MNDTFRDFRIYTENVKVNRLGYKHLFTGATENVYPRWCYKVEKYANDKLIKGWLCRYTERDIKPVAIVVFEWFNDSIVNVKLLKERDETPDTYKVIQMYSFSPDTLLNDDLFKLMFNDDADMISSVIDGALHPLSIS